MLRRPLDEGRLGSALLFQSLVALGFVLCAAVAHRPLAYGGLAYISLFLLIPSYHRKMSREDLLGLAIPLVAALSTFALPNGLPLAIAFATGALLASLTLVRRHARERSRAGEGSPGL